jgi:hypothetical protein
MLYFVMDHKVTDAHRNFGISKASAVKVYAMLRDVCAKIVLNDLAENKLGGYGRTVEIDETQVTHSKAHKGRPHERQDLWVVGGVERETRRKFAVPVKCRNRETLFQLISHFVLEGL